MKATRSSTGHALARARPSIASRRPNQPTSACPSQRISPVPFRSDERARVDRLGGRVEARPSSPRVPSRRRRSRSLRLRIGPRRRASRRCHATRPRRCPRPVNPAGWASGLPSARRTRVSTASVAARSLVSPSTSRRARSSTSTSPLTLPLIPGPTRRGALVGLPPVLGAPVEAAREREPPVRPLGEVHPDPPAHAAVGPWASSRRPRRWRRCPSRISPQPKIMRRIPSPSASLTGPRMWTGRRGGGGRHVDRRAGRSRRGPPRRGRASPGRTVPS